MPTSSPTIGSPVNWCHSVRVARSYITLLLRYRNPEVPKVVGSPLMMARYPIALLQSVHQVSDKGSPPQNIIRQLVGIDDPQWVRAMLAVDRHADHPFIIFQVIGQRIICRSVRRIF